AAARLARSPNGAWPRRTGSGRSCAMRRPGSRAGAAERVASQRALRHGRAMNRAFFSMMLGTSLLLIHAAADAQPSRDRSLRAHLRTEFHDARGTAPESRYVVAWADLNGDRRDEAIVYLISRDYCGTGGCSLYVYQSVGRSWRQVADMS